MSWREVVFRCIVGSSLSKGPFLSGLCGATGVPLAIVGRGPVCRGLLAGSKLALDAFVPQQLLLADRGLQLGGGLQQVLHGEQQC